MNERAQDERTGIVLSGGGAKGAFELGVMQALFEGKSSATGGRPISPGIYTGTSVGAINAAQIVSQTGVSALDALANLERIWLEVIANAPGRCGNGVFRFRAVPMALFEPSCLLHPLDQLESFGRDFAFLSVQSAVRGVAFLASDRPFVARAIDSFDLAAFVSNEPLRELLQDHVSLDGLRATKKKLAIIASNFKSGAPRLFSQIDIADNFGPTALLASASLPGFFPPVDIGGVPYVDGGLTINTPLKPAIQLGATILHVIYLDPLMPDIPFPRLPNTVETMYRMYAILISDNFRTDLERADAVNLEIIRARAGAEPIGKLAVELDKRQRKGRPYRPLIVHRYRPRTDLGGGLGLLNFDIDNIRRQIAEGYSVAEEHDCSEAGCLLPPEEEPVSKALETAAPGRRQR